MADSVDTALRRLTHTVPGPRAINWEVPWNEHAKEFAARYNVFQGPRGSASWTLVKQIDRNRNGSAFNRPERWSRGARAATMKIGFTRLTRRLTGRHLWTAPVDTHHARTRAKAGVNRTGSSPFSPDGPFNPATTTAPPPSSKLDASDQWSAQRHTGLGFLKSPASLFHF